MTDFLIRRFVKNADDTQNPAVRSAYGTLAAIVGICVNLLLAAGKFLTGTISGSLALTADAANNLSDAAGSVVALITVRLSSKPVDADHPFGHGRMEYLGSLGVGVLIVVMGVNLLRDAVSAILHPEAVAVSLLVIAVPVVSILFKLWLYLFYNKTGGAVNNGTLLAAAKDSLSDVLATSAVLLSMLAEYFLGWKIDGWIGLLVGLLVLKAGYEVCRDTVDTLLGSRPDPEKVQQLREIVLSHEGILGIHDLVMHDYGPSRCFASVHAEVDAGGDILAIHEMIDDIERDIMEIMGIPTCIHMDPLADTPESEEIRAQIAQFLHEYDEKLSFHDFRMVPGESHTNLIFDVLLPAGYKKQSDLHTALTAAVAEIGPEYRIVVTYDTDFT